MILMELSSTLGTSQFETIVTIPVDTDVNVFWELIINELCLVVFMTDKIFFLFRHFRNKSNIKFNNYF